MMLAYRAAHTKQFYGCFRYKHAATKIAPQLLNFELKQQRMDIAQEMLTTFNDDPDLLKKVITSDESWIYGCIIENKAQSIRFATIEEIKEKSKQ